MVARRYHTSSIGGISITRTKLPTTVTRGNCSINNAYDSEQPFAVCGSSARSIFVDEWTSRKESVECPAGIGPNIYTLMRPYSITSYDAVRFYTTRKILLKLYGTIRPRQR